MSERDFPYGCDKKEALARLKERIGDRVVVASVSGGKDSTAMCLWLKESEIEHRRVFADTGWEHPKTYEYLRGDLTRAVGPIDEVKANRSLAGYAVGRAAFPSLMHRWCTEELKVAPIKRFLKALEDEPINTIGVRASESRQRSKMTQWTWSDTLDCDVWRPLLYWSDDDVYQIHRRHGVQPNPLYLLGADRVGCWPCVGANRRNLQLVAKIDPGRIDEIRALEAEVRERENEKAQSAGRDPRYSAFFYNPTHGIYGIDDAVRWANTPPKGKRHLELFSKDDGCARWGFCESTSQAEPSDSNKTQGDE